MRIGRAMVGDSFNLHGDFRHSTVNIIRGEISEEEEREAAAILLDGMPLDRVPLTSPLPIGSRIKYAPNPLFVGRESDFKHLAKAIKNGSTTAVGQIIVATGLGGIGKTQLASEFCHRYGQFFAGGVYWLSMAEADNVYTEVADCGIALGINSDFNKLRLEEKVRRVQDAWESPMPRLLVFDNCEDDRLLAEWRPKSGGCRVLVTSRRTQWDPSLGVAALELGVLSLDESRLMLRAYRPDLNPNESLLEQVTEILGHLPLALHLAGSYLHNYRGTSRGTLSHYLEQLQSTKLLSHKSMVEAHSLSPTCHEQHVARTFELSYRLLEAGDTIDKAACNMLACAAAMDSGEMISRELLLKVAGGDEMDVAANEVQEDALRRLTELGLLQNDRDGSALRIHRLLALFTQSRIENWDKIQNQVEEMFYTKAKQINDIGLPSTLLAWQAHLRHVAKTAIGRRSSNAGMLSNELGFYLRGIADYDRARTAFEEALEADKDLLGPNHPNVAVRVNNLGSTLQQIGDLDGARDAIQKALDITEEVYGPKNNLVAIYVSNLGSVLLELDDLKGARNAFEKALEIHEEISGPKHIYVATDLNNLGTTLQEMGDLAGARKAFERALEIGEDSFGPKHPDVALYVSNLGRVLKHLGDLSGARDAAERALNIDTDIYGPEHPSVARDLSDLGGLHRKTGDLNTAREFLKRALDIDEAVVGPEHFRIALRLNNYGNVLQEMGDVAGAKAAFERALKIREAVFGPKHPMTRAVKKKLRALRRGSWVKFFDYSWR